MTEPVAQAAATEEPLVLALAPGSKTGYAGIIEAN